MKRILLWSTGGGVALLSVAMVATLLWLRSTLPDYSKMLTNAALQAPVEIIRDRHGVAHIAAQSFEDAAFAMGYAQAQDRLWQMEVLRRASQGRSAEIFGAAFFARDAWYRAIKLPQIAEKTLLRLDPPTRRVYRAFAAGVNAAIDAGEGSRSPEWAVLGVKPARWSAADVGALMAVIAETADDSKYEAAKAWLAAVYDAEAVALLNPQIPADFPTLYDEHAAAPRGSAVAAPAGPATNFFVVAAEKSTSGAPLLAVDPHLPLHAPSLIYPVAISLPGDIIRGGAWIGGPAIAFGHNSRIAWGMTHLMGDVTDFIVERIDPHNPDAYLTPQGPKPFIVREESIGLRGGEERTLILRSTENGTVVSDADILGADADSVEMRALATFGPGHVLVRRQVNSEVGSLTTQSLIKVSRAHSWAEFRRALRDYEWQNNVVYADRDGNIGVQAAARLPLRRQVNGWNGQRLARGWLGEGKWDGWVPFDDLPAVFNPERGWLADANSRAVGVDHRVRIADHWASPWRVKRAYQLLAAQDRHSAASLAAIQTDIHSAQAAWLLPRMLALPARSPAAERARALLADWNFEMAAGAAQPLLYAAVERALQERLIGEKNQFLAGNDPQVLALANMLDTNSHWCDAVATPQTEDCAAAVDAAFAGALAEIESSYGANPQHWRWGDAHEARFPAFFSWGHLPLLGALTAPHTPHGGGENTLNVGGGDYSSQQPYTQVGGATFRMVIDLADLNTARFMVVPGVSGNVASPHWGDQVESWAAGDYFTLSLRPQNPDRRTLISPPGES